MINVVWHESAVSREMRENRNGHRGALIWFTGLSGSGKSTLAKALEQILFLDGMQALVLDGDNIRHGLCSDLGFSPDDRKENIRRIGEVSKLFVSSGFIVLAAFISPYAVDRQLVRSMFNQGDFVEVFCDSPIDVCEKRDVKGFYEKARKGEIKSFTGISAPYEVPSSPEIIIDTANQPLNICVSKINDYLVSTSVIQKYIL